VRKSIALLMVLGLLAGACGGSDANSCENFADRDIDIMQRWLDEVDTMTPGEMMAPEEPAFMSDVEAELLALQLEAQDAGCDVATIDRLVRDRTDRLSAESPMGQMMLELIKSEGAISSTE
jgi:hypothetical protein